MSGDSKLQQILADVDKMGLTDLLFIQSSPQTFLNEEFKTEINGSKNLINEIYNNEQRIKQLEFANNSQNQQFQNEFLNTKTEIEKTKDNINKLLLEKNKYNKQISQKEFLSMLDKEIKIKFKKPESHFKDFLDNKISLCDLQKNLESLANGKNYYYYKIISDKLHEI